MQEGEAVRCPHWKMSDHFFYILNDEILFSDTSVLCSLRETFMRAYEGEMWEIYERGYVVLPKGRKCNYPVAKDGKWYY